MKSMPTGCCSAMGLGLQGQLLASTTTEILLDYFTCEGEIITTTTIIIISSSTWQTTETLPQDELLLSLAPAQFGMGIAVGVSCHQELASHGEIKPQDTFTFCLHSPQECNWSPRN